MLRKYRIPYCAKIIAHSVLGIGSARSVPNKRLLRQDQEIDRFQIFFYRFRGSLRESTKRLLLCLRTLDVKPLTMMVGIQLRQCQFANIHWTELCVVCNPNGDAKPEKLQRPCLI